MWVAKATLARYFHEFPNTLYLCSLSFSGRAGVYCGPMGGPDLSGRRLTNERPGSGHRRPASAAAPEVTVVARRPRTAAAAHTKTAYSPACLPPLLWFFTLSEICCV